MPSYAIGIDVGGASARVGLVSDAGRILFRASFPTGIGIRGPRFLERIERCCRQALAVACRRRVPVRGIGIAMPAFVDERGRVAGASNLPGLNGVAVARRLERSFRQPTRIENDVSAAALGEYYFGRHRSGRMLLVAIGTGIGAGFIVDGGIFRLSQGCLGDPGHIIVDGSGLVPCRCGGNGCLEAVASGWALVEAAGRQGLRATPRRVFALGRAGHPICRPLISRAATAVGLGLATLCALLNPDEIVLGGGVAIEGGPAFSRRVARVLRAHAVPFLVRGVPVVSARVGRDAGLAGAAALVLFRPLLAR